MLITSLGLPVGMLAPVVGFGADFGVQEVDGAEDDEEAEPAGTVASWVGLVEPRETRGQTKSY